MTGLIFYVEKNIHGEWVICGQIGIRKYIGYSKTEAIKRYKDECRKTIFTNQ